jgi:hypothetical protein
MNMGRILALTAVATMISFGTFLFVDYLNHAHHVKVVDELFLQHQERDRQAMLKLCKTYRDWQSLQDIKPLTGMDEICNRYESTGR